MFQLTLTDREILPDDPSIIGLLKKQFKQAFSSFTRDRRTPQTIRKKLAVHISPRKIIMGIEPTYNKIKNTANFFSNAVGKGDVL